MRRLLFCVYVLFFQRPAQGEQADDQQCRKADAAEYAQAQIIARQTGNRARERGAGRAAEIAR